MIFWLPLCGLQRMKGFPPGFPIGPSLDVKQPASGRERKPARGEAAR